MEATTIMISASACMSRRHTEA